MEITKRLSDAEIDKLAEFLTSDETPEECMDLSTLDGFLTGLVIGPDTIMPSQWLPVVWGETKSDEMAWEVQEEGGAHHGTRHASVQLNRGCVSG